MSNVPDHTDNQPGEFVDDPENTPGQQDTEAPQTPPGEVAPDDQSDG